MKCPRCARELTVSFCTGGRMLRCKGCGGTAVTVEMLRRFAPKERVDHLWRDVMEHHGESGPTCTGCDGHLRTVKVGTNGVTVRLDACPHCHVVWFDEHELHAFSPQREEPPAEDLRAAEAERLGIRAATPVARDEIWRLVTGLQGLLT